MRVTNCILIPQVVRRPGLTARFMAMGEANPGPV